MKKFNAIIPLLVCSMLLIGCNTNPGGGGNTVVNNIAVESVFISGNGNGVVKGASLDLVANITPANATNKNVTWSSDDERVATVDQTGRVTGVEYGRTVIRARTEDGGFVATYKVVVTKNGTKVVGLSDLVEDMINSDYQINETGLDKYGLSDPTIVGARADMAEQVLYEVPADSEFESAAIINVMDVTLEQAQQFFSVTELTDNVRIRTAIRLAKAQNDNNKVAKIVFPENGHMHLSGADIELHSGSSHPVIYVQDLNGTYFVGNGCLLEINMQGTTPAGYFSFKNCKNVYMNGFIFDQDAPTAITGTVKSYDLDLKKITLDVLPEDYEVARRHKNNPGTIKGYIEFHEITEAPVQGGNCFAGNTTCSADPVITGDDASGYQITLTFATKIAEPAIGTYGVAYYSQYDAFGMRVDNSENMYFDDVTIHNASGMAFGADYVNTLYLNRFNIVRRENSHSMVTSTADGLHFSMMQGTVKVTNSIIEYTGDDALNVKHGYYYRVSERSSSFTKKITLQQITSAMPEPQVGDHIAIYNEDTFASENPASGYYTVEAVENTNGIYTVTTKEKLVGTAEEWGNCRATFISRTPDFEFSNNIVRNKRNRGILVQVPHPVVTNNTFNRVGHGSMMIHSVMDIFNEATLPQYPTITNNKVLNGCYLANGALNGDTALFANSKNGNIGPKGTIKGLQYNNNFVANNGTAAVSLRATGDNTIEDNLFVNIAVLENMTETVKGVISLNNTGTTVIKNNYNYNERSQNLNGVVLRGLSGTNDVTLENNFDLEYEKVEGEAGPEVHIAKTTNNITVDGSLADWEGSGAHDVVFNGYSFADNTRTSKEAVADHFQIKTFKMTYKDEGIYLGFDIMDNKVVVDQIDQFWYEDCVEILATNVIDKPTADLQVYCKENDGDCLQLALTPTWQYTVAAVRSSTAAIQNKADIRAKVVLTEDGYRGECLIPFTVVPSWATSIADGKQIDMALVVGDGKRDSEGLPRLQAGNVPHFVENYKTMTNSMPQYFFE